MDAYAVNERAVVHAYELIDQRRYVLGTDWEESHPRFADQRAFVADHSWDAFALWHLATVAGRDADSVGHYQFAYGDFHRVHRSALVSCLQRAEQGGHRFLAEVSMELLRRLDAKVGIAGDVDSQG